MAQEYNPVVLFFHVDGFDVSLFKYNVTRWHKTKQKKNM